MTTQPPGTDVARVTPVFESLMDRYDKVVAAILADPRVAADASDARIRAYLELFPPGSTFAQGTVESWVQLGQRGRFYIPGPRGEMYDTTVMTVTPRAADDASFTVCTRRSVVIRDAAGVTVEAQGGTTAGTVVAVRIEGRWLLRDLTAGSSADCPPPGAG